MSKVYLGFDPLNGRQVAIKILAEHLQIDQHARERFQREALLGCSLESPFIVRTFGCEHDSELKLTFLVLEFVDGPSCQFLLDRTGPLAVGDATRIILDAAHGLAYLHAKDLVHRDIKPGNILLATNGMVKIADFGLVKDLIASSDLTALNQGFGTSWYMPLEQVLNARSVDARSDLFALGATFYHLLTGSVPFYGANHAEIVAAKRLGTYIPASQLNPSVPRAIDSILAKLLARDPEQRFPSARRLIQALERSGIANEVPSFLNADARKAVSCPSEVAVDHGQPTKPDLSVHSTDQAKKSTTDASCPATWQLRYRDAEGRSILRNAQTEQVLAMLRDRRIPFTAEASRKGYRHFRPLHVYPEFLNAIPAASVVQAAVRSRNNAVSWMPPCTDWQLLVSSGFGVGLIAAALCRMILTL